MCIFCKRFDPTNDNHQTNNCTKFTFCADCMIQYPYDPLHNMSECTKHKKILCIFCKKFNLSNCEHFTDDCIYSFCKYCTSRYPKEKLHCKLECTKIQNPINAKYAATSICPKSRCPGSQKVGYDMYGNDRYHYFSECIGGKKTWLRCDDCGYETPSAKGAEVTLLPKSNYS